MKKKTKISIIIASFLVVIGSAMFCTAMAKNNWDFTALSFVKYEENIHYIKENFENIFIDTNLDNVTFEKIDSDECKIECYEMDKVKHFAKVENGTLKIGIVDERKWYEHIGIVVESPKIKIYLPKQEYNLLDIECTTGIVEIPKDFIFGNINVKVTTGDVKCLASSLNEIKIKSTTGSIKVSELVAKSLELKASTGDINVKNVECDEKVKINADTGDVSLKNVIATDVINIKTDTGEVNIENSDAMELYITTDTGDVRGSLLTDKVFIVETDTGDIDVPKTISGGKCDIKTDTGDIKIKIKK